MFKLSIISLGLFALQAAAGPVARITEGQNVNNLTDVPGIDMSLIRELLPGAYINCLDKLPISKPDIVDDAIEKFMSSHPWDLIHPPSAGCSQAEVETVEVKACNVGTRGGMGAQNVLIPIAARAGLQLLKAYCSMEEGQAGPGQIVGLGDLKLADGWLLQLDKSSSIDT